jgi:1,4-alpha-glucan branching enzyme
VSIKKQYLKKSPVCKVTFTYPRQAAASINTAHVVGDFNDWNTAASPMKKLKNGSFAITLTLARAREYQFRYLLDHQRWDNDWAADKYLPNEHGGENSVAVV